MAQPTGDESSTTAERLRIVRHLIGAPPKEGGAGIIPKDKEWKNVESIFPLHDPAFNKGWIKKWSTLTFLKREDLDEIRDMFGEKVSASTPYSCEDTGTNVDRLPTTSPLHSSTLPP